MSDFEHILTSRPKTPLRIPGHLYNRAKERRALEIALTEASADGTSIITVTGETGVGKTSLVQSFRKSLHHEDAFFLHGTFSSLARETPYTAIDQATRQLIRLVGQQPADIQNQWKANLKKAVQEDGDILTRCVPELEQVLGPTRHKRQHRPLLSEKLFIRGCRNFLRTACRSGPPVVLFLDNLHLADAASLRLLQHMLEDGNLLRFLLILAYPDAKANDDGILSSYLESFSSHQPIQELHLDNLLPANTEDMLARSLQKDRKLISDLATACQSATQGNPLFLKTLMTLQESEGNIRKTEDLDTVDWVIDPAACRQLPGSLLEAINQTFSLLSDSVREVLLTASVCVESFTAGRLSAVLDYSLEVVETSLDTAHNLGLLKVLDNGLTEPEYSYYFANELIHDTARSLLSENKIREIHLALGRYLLSSSQSAGSARRIYQTVYHLNRVHDLINQDEEKLEIAAVNLRAGRAVKGFAATSVSLLYFQAGLSILPHDSWQSHYQQTMALHTQGSEAAYLCAEYALSEELFQTAIAHSEDIFDTCKAYSVRIDSLKSQNRLLEAISSCLEILGLLGIHFPENPGRLRMLWNFYRSRIQLARHSHSSLLGLQRLEDKRAKAAMGFLHSLSSTCYSCKPGLIPLISAQIIRLTLRYGNCSKTTMMGYLMHSYLLCSMTGSHVADGYSLGQMALKLQRQLNGQVIFSQPLYLFNNLISHWKHHIQSTIPALKVSIQSCLESGEYNVLAHAAYSCSYRLYSLGTNLKKAMREMDSLKKQIEMTGEQMPLHRQNIYMQAVSNLLGESDDPTILKGSYYNEEELLPIHQEARDNTTLFHLWLVKLIHACMFRKYQEALLYSEAAAGKLESVKSSIFVPIYFFYDAITRLALCNTKNLAHRLRTRKTIWRCRQKMKQWAHLSPENYSHKYFLIEAERERVFGNTERAMEFYDKAIQSARKNGYLQEEALAYELAASFFATRRKDHIARPYLREARYCYYRWGATTKVRDLDAREWSFPISSAGEPLGSEIPFLSASTLIPEEGGSRLDMMTVIKASRILASEMVMDELLKKVMHIMLEGASAQRGFLLFKERGEWLFKVRGSIYRNPIVSLTETPVETQNIASSTIIKYVINEATDVVLNNACREGLFTSDPYIMQKRPRSILCMPIIHQGDIFCILYLENNLSTGAFPPDRQELLQLLGTQAAISLKNSRLFEELEQAVGRLNSEIDIRKHTQLQLMHSEKLSALGRLSASIAHEFGNPLLGVKYLIDDFHTRMNLSEGDKKLIELGVEECERMKNLIGDLQQLNKPSSGKTTRVDIHNLIDNVLLFQKKHFSSHNIVVRKQYDYTTPKVRVVEDQITQVLFNLTMNAVDAMKDGDGTLTVVTRQKSDGLSLEVVDTGAGIPYENQERIFEPFYSTKKEEDGTGLGLSISYGIVQHHRGSLSFYSEPGKGTTFTLYLPAAPNTVSPSTG